MRTRTHTTWLSVAIFVAAAGASATEAMAAITSTNTTNDATNVTYAFQYSTAGSRYQAFIDVDRNPTTGYQKHGIGADYMLEGSRLLRHTTPGFNWQEVRHSLPHSTANNTATWTFARADIGETNCTSESSDVVFQVQTGSPADISGRLFHTFIPCGSALVNDVTTNDATNVFYRVQYSSTWDYFHVFIDTDQDPGTGYPTKGIGADYFLENGNLRKHAGGTGWTWQPPVAVPYSNAGGVASWTVGRAALGETLTDEWADVVYHAQKSPAQVSLPKHTHAYFGGSGIKPGGPAGTIVPLYSRPTTPHWQAIVDAKRSHGSTAVIAVVNPASGPGTSIEESYRIGIANLSANGITVVGYVSTVRGARNESLVRTDIDNWRSFYPSVVGIFFDEMSTELDKVSYYVRQDGHARSKGFTYTVGNAGTETLPSYVGVVDTIIVYERAGLAPLPNWYMSYPRERFAVIPYNVSFDTSYIADAKARVGYVYLTDDNLPNAWDTLTSYFSALLDRLAL